MVAAFSGAYIKLHDCMPLAKFEENSWSCTIALGYRLEKLKIILSQVQ